MSSSTTIREYEISFYGSVGAYPKGSPTTRNAMSTLSASFRISSLDDSTISRSAMMTERP